MVILIVPTSLTPERVGMEGETEIDTGWGWSVIDMARGVIVTGTGPIAGSLAMFNNRHQESISLGSDTLRKDEDRYK